MMQNNEINSKINDREVGEKPKKRHKSFCLDCKTEIVKELYMVHDVLWESAFSKKEKKQNPECYGELCIGCLEKRIKRTLQAEDFTDCWINFIDINKKEEERDLFEKSTRFEERLGSEKQKRERYERMTAEFRNRIKTKSGLSPIQN